MQDGRLDSRMAVLGVAQELPDSPQGDFELGKHVITRKWLVETNDYNDGPLVVTAAVGLPKFFDIYVTSNESHPYARCRHIEAERVEPNSLYWHVTATYETPEPRDHGYGSREKSGTGTDTAGEYQNPLLELAEIDCRFETVQVPITQIYNVQTGQLQAVQASNGEIFDPPPMKDESRLVLSITRNENVLAPHPALAVQYQDAVNSDVFWGSPPGTVKCQSITVQRQTRQIAGGAVFPYLKVTYTFQFKASWDLQILDAGTWYYDSSSGTQVKTTFKSEDQQPIQGLLDGSGHKLSDGADPVFITVRPYVRLPFGALGLPQSFTSVG